MSLKKLIAVWIVFFVSLTALSASSYFLPVRGLWLDRLVSSVLSRYVSFPVECRGVTLRHWAALSLESCRIFPAGFAKEPFVLENILARLSVRKTYNALHILRCRSKDFSVKGGVALSKDGILKVHGVILKNHRKPSRILCYTKVHGHDGTSDSGNPTRIVPGIL